MCLPIQTFIDRNVPGNGDRKAQDEASNHGDQMVAGSSGEVIRRHHFNLLLSSVLTYHGFLLTLFLGPYYMIVRTWCLRGQAALSLKPASQTSCVYLVY
jgi:hypothetical protein